MGDTVLGYETQRKTTYDALAGGARTSLGAAQTALAAAAELRTPAVKEIAKQLELRAHILEALGKVSIPAEADPLLAQLEGAVIAIRVAQAGLLAADDALALAGGKGARAAAKLKRAEAGLADAIAVEKAALSRSDEHTAWKGVLGSSAFTAAVSEAQGNFAPDPTQTQNYAAAKARAEGDIPAPLLSRARARQASALVAGATRQAAVSSAVASYRTERNDHGGLVGEAHKLGAEFEDHRDRLRERANHTLERIAQALALLAAIPQTAARSADEIARTTALAAAGATAATAEADYHAAIGTPNEATARAAYLLIKVNLDKWEASVADRLWKNLADFDLAVRILTELQGFDPATLITDFDDKEDKYAKKLAGALASTLALADFEESLLELQPAATSAASPDRIFSALRGDG